MNDVIQRTAALTVALVFSAATTAAQAQGTARIQQSDGVIREYKVSLHVIDHRAVRITSNDGRGTLTVSKAACSYAGDLERCLPYNIVLDQFGAKHTIEIQHGTEYLNRTGTVAPLPLSSNHVPPHGLLLLLLTERGTYISVRGTIDGFSE